MKINAINNNSYQNKSFKATLLVGNKIMHVLEKNARIDDFSDDAIKFINYKFLEKVEEVTKDIEPKLKKVYWDLKNDKLDTFVSVPLPDGERRLAVDAVNLNNEKLFEILPEKVKEIIELSKIILGQ